MGGGPWFLKENIWLQNSQEGGNSIQPKNKLITSLEAALKLNKNDPETLIFLNNARIVTAKNYTIVASVPLGTDPNGSLEILRGIAQAQHEINAGEELREYH
ncbi:hypothetical protein [Fischerella thermalis]|uniref:hypothetical protein n=1 Tax=Fischerella thermalis TaxID=372787 RepID=UPI00030E136C|nr:hypothetical protein [Fischerella thermalis]